MCITVADEFIGIVRGRQDWAGTVLGSRAHHLTCHYSGDALVLEY